MARRPSRNASSPKNPAKSPAAETGKTTVKVFACHNTTNQWAVIVDGRIGLFDSESEAREVFATIGGTAGSDGLAETPFMSADLLAPGYRCDGCFHGTHDDIAHHVGQASDVRAYIAAAWAESKGGQA